MPVMKTSDEPYLKMLARRLPLVPTASIILGLLLTCMSIVVVGKKSPFNDCSYTGQALHVLDRGAPFTYFTVDPSVSTCEPVDSVSAVWAINAGNDVNKKAFLADWLIWTALSAGAILIIRKLR